MIKRIFTTKKSNFNIDEEYLLKEIREFLNINAQEIKIFERYDIEGLDEEYLDTVVNLIISQQPTDEVFMEKLPNLDGYKKIAVELLPGQYNQRADATMQSIEFLTKKQAPTVKCARVYAFKGISDNQLNGIINYLINPVESMQTSMDKPLTLQQDTCQTKKAVATVEGFIEFDDETIQNYYDTQTLAMTLDDLIFVRDYFIKEKRNPTITELKVIDTYWSDHCRHTTFLTELENIEISTDNIHITKAKELYDNLFKDINGDDPDKYVCLMDMATIVAKHLRKTGELDNLDISDEINACSVEVDVDNDGQNEKWLIMFKNETHNHPTEIEPFGGAATCLGGAIRDPLSGRAYVYQGMRITGSADPNEKIQDTLTGKLPQRVISTTAAKGFSSYGNQIGTATGLVNEIYHENYKAKRLEAGYVIGGVPKENVVRNKPRAGDLIVLVGGRTGRDGCGGATGSSKAHTEDSLTECGAEVQKGNPSIERNIQRLFRNKEATRLIIKCNDFGAGGVSVAVGELAESLDIFLDKVPTKYEGLDGTELAISESQERMAVVLNKNNLNKFIALCQEENLNAVNIAEVTSNGRIRMFYNDKVIVDLKRSFLESNGVKQFANVLIKSKNKSIISKQRKELIALSKTDIKSAIIKDISKLNNCSQKGLIEMFDNTAGSSSILLPLGGRKQLTPSIVMASKPPVSGETNTATVSSFGCPIKLLETCPFTGAIYSVILSINKLIASGVPLSTIRLSLQEFFKRLGDDANRWGEVTSAMLGALYAQYNLGIGAIGGKDSMSGSFHELDVPPTLISFSMGIGKADTLINNVFKKGQKLFIIKLKRDEDFIPDFKYLNKIYNIININIEKGNIISATVAETDTMVALIKSLLGDKLGISFAKAVDETFMPSYGDFIVAVKDISQLHIEDAEYLGIVNDTGIIRGSNFEISIDKIYNAYNDTLENVFPTINETMSQTKDYTFEVNQTYKCRTKIAKPRIFIPVLPGTSGEYDMARRFAIAGGDPEIIVLKNQSIQDIEESIAVFEKAISESQIIALAGGYSMGNEPDGGGKFIATVFSNTIIKNAIDELLTERDGLILGLGDGFQGLIKLGLLPYGRIKPQTKNSPTLFRNSINRHISTIARVRVASNLSPWFSRINVGEIYCTPVSTSEGRFIAPSLDLLNLVENGQIATQYVDSDNKASMQSPYNPTGSQLAIEAITSSDGRILGKIGHSDRIGDNLYKNVEGDYDMQIFESGIEYFA